MKASELQEGRDYSYQRGQYSTPVRVTIVEAPVAAKGNLGYGPRTHAAVRWTVKNTGQVVRDRVPLSQIVRTWEEQEEVNRLNEEYKAEQRKERLAAQARREELNQRLQALGLDFSVNINYGGYATLVSTEHDGFEAAEELIRRVTKGEEK